MVNFFGWTLGGFYLARYSSSPVGPFDELVALAGLAWNFPTSCAWAARVYVNKRSARDHGLHVVGLPSRLASFKARPKPSTDAHAKVSAHTHVKGCCDVHKESWWSDSPSGKREKECGCTSENIEIRNREGGWSHPLQLLGWKRKDVSKGLRHPVCSIDMPASKKQWTPSMQMSLPSYSGATPLCPGLLKYSLRLFTKIRFVPPVKVTLHDDDEIRSGRKRSESTLEALGTVLGGRPLVCMSFEDMRMEVQAPERLELRERSSVV